MSFLRSHSIGNTKLEVNLKVMRATYANGAALKELEYNSISGVMTVNGIHTIPKMIHEDTFNKVYIYDDIILSVSKFSNINNNISYINGSDIVTLFPSNIIIHNKTANGLPRDILDRCIGSLISMDIDYNTLSDGFSAYDEYSNGTVKYYHSNLEWSTVGQSGDCIMYTAEYPFLVDMVRNTSDNTSMLILRRNGQDYTIGFGIVGSIRAGENAYDSFNRQYKEWIIRTSYKEEIK